MAFLHWQRSRSGVLGCSPPRLLELTLAGPWCTILNGSQSSKKSSVAGRHLPGQEVEVEVAVEVAVAVAVAVAGGGGSGRGRNALGLEGRELEHVQVDLVAAVAGRLPAERGARGGESLDEEVRRAGPGG
jgi:hypothetical protein